MMKPDEFSQIFAQLARDTERLSPSEYFSELTATMAKPEIAGAYVGLIRSAGVDLADKVAVDLGCKYGHTLLLMLAMGAKRAIGIDAHRPYVEEASRILAPLYPQLQFQMSEEGYLELPSATIDLVLVNEVISHVNPSYLPVLYVEIARVLKPGGALLISDGNNWANKECRADLVKVYDAWENGPAGRDTGRDVVLQSFRDQRRDLIAKIRPDLDAKTIDFLADTTFGLFGGKLEAVARNYRAGGSHVERRAQPCVAPTNPHAGGYVMERWFHPRQVELDLETIGFDARQLMPAATAGGLKHFIKVMLGRLRSGFGQAAIEARRGESWGFVVLATKRAT